MSDRIAVLYIAGWGRSGNPDRFATGRIRTRADDAWRSAIGASQYALVTALSLPWLRRYGYTMTAR